MIRTLLIAVFCFMASVSFAAMPKKITLHDAVMLALRMNPTIQNAEIDRTVSRFAFVVARHEFLPQYSLEGQSDFNIANDMQKTQNNQLTPATHLSNRYGTRYSLAWHHQYSSQNGRRYEPELSLTIEQPLLRDRTRMITDFEAATLSELSSRLNYKNVLITQINQVLQDYRAIIQDKLNITIQEDSLHTIEVQIEQTKSKIRAGSVARSELNDLKTQLYRNRLALVTAKNTASTHQQILLTDLGLDPNYAYTVEETVHLNHLNLLDLKKSQQIALKNNPDYQQQLINLARATNDLQATQSSVLPQLDLTLSGTVARQHQRSAAASIVYRIPIHDLRLQQRLFTARSNLTKVQRDTKQAKWQLETEVLNQYRTLKKDLELIKITELSIESAQRSYNIARKQLSLGQVTTFELTQKAQILISNRQSVLENKINFLNDEARFHALLGLTLDDWHIQLPG